MGTPQAVLDAEAEADRLIAELASAQATPEDQDTDEDIDSTLADSGEAQADDIVDDSDDGAVDTSVDSLPDEDGTPVETVVTDETPELSAQLADLQEKFEKLQAAHDTLRGKTYAEVPRTINENKALKDKVAELEARIASAAPVPARGPSAEASEILASLKEDVNEDVADRIQQLVDVTVSERVKESLTPVMGEVDTLQKSALERAQESYVKELTSKVPDWRTIAANPEYSAMLSEKDAVSGQTLYDLATGALERLDADHMAVFYNKFKELKGITDTKGDGEKSTSTRPTGKAALISPKGAAKTKARESGEEKPDYITTRQMERFNKNRANMSPEAEAKMEARIDRAIRKRWIVP